jgi:hypothetical protein
MSVAVWVAGVLREKFPGIPKDPGGISCRPSACFSGESDSTGQKMANSTADQLHTFPNSGIVIL